MKVIVNAAGYVGQEAGAGGAGVFLQYLVAQLAKDTTVDVLVRPNSNRFGKSVRGARFIELPYLTGDVFRRLRDGVTAVIDPFGALPCDSFPDDMALCTVVHDLMHLEAPYYFTAAERLGRSASFAQGLQRADSIVTFTADQARAVRQFYPGTVPAVIPHLPYMCLNWPAGAEHGALPAGLDEFILCPAVKWPHKNHKTVIEAFSAYLKSTNSNLKLVLCGGACAESRFSYFPSSEGWPSGIVDLGRVSDEVLHALYAKATALVFPTLYEGFGIPVLEAAYLGKMVVASRLAVFDEILGAENYCAIEDPRCHRRWMDAFAQVDGSARAAFEARSLLVKQAVNPDNFRNAFLREFRAIGERYTHPSLYPARKFPQADRVTSGVAARLEFSDIYGFAASERGPRNPGLGHKPAAVHSSVFRSLGAGPDAKQCLRATYDVPALVGAEQTLEFLAWIRLPAEGGLEQLNWSVNDGGVIDILPELADGNWFLLRRKVPASGYIDFRGVRDGRSEIAGFEIELHDAAVMLTENMPVPEAVGMPRGLTILVTALPRRAQKETKREAAVLGDAVEAVRSLNLSLGTAAKALRWVLVTNPEGVRAAGASLDLPANTRCYVTERDDPDRAGMTSVISPYEPVYQLLLLDAADLPSCAAAANLALLARAASPIQNGAGAALELKTETDGLWRPAERGRIMSAAHRAGEPVPLLDAYVVDSLLTKEQAPQKPRFAVIETDRTSSVSHHGVVTSLFLKGAQHLGFEPILGLNLTAAGNEADEVKTWSGFGAQVYAVGSAEAYAEELSRFVSAMKLGPGDVIFMHSLSPQILLGTARFVAASPAAPRFIMRFFSTAEAMGGHKLSYVKILKSIMAVSAVRARMTFFCESRNLAHYYKDEVGADFPLLFNPLHPSLEMVRESTWFDANLGGGKLPVLAYFGEAREEKGFDFIPGILAELLTSPVMAGFQFLIQTGSNSNNDTPRIAQAKVALAALKVKFPGRIRTFESAETSEQFYFLMKHATAVIAPYRPQSYSKRGTGVTLEAIQMGLDVFALEETDLYGTFDVTGHLIGVRDDKSFAHAIIDYYKDGLPVKKELAHEYRLLPHEVCERMFSLCTTVSAEPSAGAVLWVGNDTFGEGCSSVYSAQKHALRDLGYDCLELFVPWPDRNWSGVDPGAYDARIYGFATGYEPSGLAWVALPHFDPGLFAVLDEVESAGNTFDRLRRINTHFAIPPSLEKAISTNHVDKTLLNYAHLYPVIEELVPLSQITCETHDIVAYQHAVRRGDAVSLSEKLDEFTALAQFPRLIAISAAEQRELENACIDSKVYWRLPPFTAEPPLQEVLPRYWERYNSRLLSLGDVPELVLQPSLAMLRTYYARPDVQEVFSLSSEGGRLAFFQWFFFNGQQATADTQPFTRPQLDWLLGTRADGLRGVTQLIVAARDDVYAAFTTESGVNIAGLDDWMVEHGEREFGVSFAKLQRLAGELEQRSAAYPSRLLTTLLDAGPARLGTARPGQKPLYELLEDVGQIDLVLVGSGHPANIVSFRWFINEVFLKYFRDRQTNLFIVGSACEQLQDVTERNIYLLGRCARVSPLLHAARACPLPVVAGSGSPIKTIPAMALNGAVTITKHIEEAFKLSAYDIPAISDPWEFASDLMGLLDDNTKRQERCARAAKYVEENLTSEGYTAFWKTVLEGN